MNAPHAAAPYATRVAAQGRYELMAMLKNGEQLMLNIALPLTALVVLAHTAFLDPYAREFSASRLDFAVPGVLALCIVSTALSGQGIATGFDRRYGVLRFLSTTPLGKSGLVLGKVIAVLLVICIQYALVILLSLFLGWHLSVMGILMSIPTVLLGAAAFTSLGLLIAGTVRAEATLVIVNMAWGILAAGGGTLIPQHHLPSFFNTLVDFLPSGALGSALRAEFISHHFLLMPHLVLLAWTALSGLLASKYFKWSA